MKNGIIALTAGALALAGCNKRVGGPGADTNERHGHAAGYTIGRQAPLTADPNPALHHRMSSRKPNTPSKSVH